MKISTYNTLIEALEKLKSKGFKYGFKLKGNHLECLETGKQYGPEELRSVEYYRFEGESNPSDMSVVFALIAADGYKGTVVSGYGTYANMPLISFLNRVKIADRTSAAGK